MPMFLVEQVMQTYATIEVEAESMADLRENYDAYLDVRDDWLYETDYDSAESHNITPIAPIPAVYDPEMDVDPIHIEDYYNGEFE